MLLSTALDYAAGTVTVTTMKQVGTWSTHSTPQLSYQSNTHRILKEDHEWPNNPAIDGGVLDSKIEVPIRDAYAAAVEAGVPFPAGVQIVGLPHQEERVLGMLMQLEKALAN